MRRVDVGAWFVVMAALVAAPSGAFGQTAGGSDASPDAPQVEATPRPPDPRPRALRTRQFLFDGGIRAGRLLAVEFARGVATVAPDGTPVAADAPRFARERAVGTSAPMTPILNVNRRILAGGYDADGDGRLLVVNMGEAELDLFAVDGPEVVELGQWARGPVLGTSVAAGGGDISHWTLPGTEDIFDGADRVLRMPRAGTIAHGLVVVLFETARRLDESGPDGLPRYAVDGSALLATTSDGAAWQVIESDHDDPQQPGRHRGREWSIQGYATPWRRDDGPVLDVWIGVASYLLRGEEAGVDDDARAGRVFVIRGTRAAQHAPWTIAPVARFDAPLVDPGDAANHTHAAAITECVDAAGRRGIQVLVSMGDGGSRNQIDRLVLVDPDADYDPDDPAAWSPPFWNTGPAGPWEVQPRFHGSVANADAPGRLANQFVGFVQGRRMGELVVGNDNETEALMRLVPGDAESVAPRFESLGRTAIGGSAINLGILSDAPERGRFVAALGDTLHPAETRRLLYSGDYGASWTDLAPVSGGTYSGAIVGDVVFVTDNTAGGLQRVPRPEQRRMRPICVAPGGRSMLRASDGLAAGAHDVEILVRGADGRFRDGADVLPPAPFLSQVVWRIDAVPGASDPLGVARQIGGPDLPWSPTDNRRRARFWVLCGQRTHGVSYTATMSDGTSWMPAHRIGQRSMLRVYGDDWISMPVSRDVALPSPAAPLIVGHELAASMQGVAAQRLYVAVDNVLEGPGGVGYPLPAEGVAAPDEVLRVTNVGLETGRMLRVVGAVPEDAWDQFFTTFDEEIPICTLSAVTGDRIEVVAQPFRRHVVVRGVIGGHAMEPIEFRRLSLLRGTQLDLALAIDERGGLHAGVAVHGAIRTASRGGWAGLGADGGHGLTRSLDLLELGAVGGHTGDWCWFGGETVELPPDVDPAAAITAAFGSLDVLVPGIDGPCAGDANGDFVIDLDDLNAVLHHWGATDATRAEGDLDGDGIVGMDDLIEVLTWYGRGCV